MATVVTNAGLAIITNRVKGGGTEPAYIDWGTGVAAAAATDTALDTPGGEARVLGTSTQETTSVTSDTYRVVGTMTEGGAGATIAEAGLFDAATVGNMFVSADFTGVALSNGESIQFTFNVQFS
jgi:hypothetical protein